MKAMYLPIKNFLVVSEDEDVHDLNTTDYEEAVELLDNIRDEQNGAEWALVAEIDA